MRTSVICMLALSAGIVSAIPAPSRVSQMKRSNSSSCTFTSAADASASAKACSTVTLNNIKVPAGETLDLSDLQDGTKVPLSDSLTMADSC